MNIEQRLKEYILSLDQSERVDYMKKQAQNVARDYKSMVKASDAEFNYNGARMGVRGGKRTTLTANAVNKTQAYQSSLKDLKIIISYL